MQAKRMNGHRIAKLAIVTFWENVLWKKPLSFTFLRRVLITTAHLDPLRDQGEAFAGRLIEQGVSVQSQRLPATIHDFIGSPKSLRSSSTMAAEMLREVNTD